MPFNPQQLDIGAGALAGGINSLGNSLASAMLEHKKTKEETQAADAAAQALAGIFQQNQVPLPEGWAKFPGMSASAKKAFLGTATMGLTTALQERERQQNNQMQNLHAQIAAGNFNLNQRRDAREQGEAQGIANAVNSVRNSLHASPSLNFSPVEPGQEQAAFGERLMQALGGDPRTAGSPLAQKLMLERMQGGQAPFEPSGTMVDVGGIKIPVVKTSRNSAQPLEGFALDAQGRASGKYRESDRITPAQRLQSIDRQLAAYKEYTVGPMAKLLTDDDRALIASLKAQREEILNPNGASSPAPKAAPAPAAPAGVAGEAVWDEQKKTFVIKRNKK